MTNISAYLPAKGDTLWEFKGGPWDKMGLSCDMDLAPTQITLDGHVYSRRVVTAKEMGLDPEKYVNDPHDLITTDYVYKGAPHGQEVQPTY